MYLQKVISRKTFKKISFFVDVFKVKDENIRIGIRIHWSRGRLDYLSFSAGLDSALFTLNLGIFLSGLRFFSSAGHLFKLLILNFI
jgi:hypothetical protein